MRFDSAKRHTCGLCDPFVRETVENGKPQDFLLIFAELGQRFHGDRGLFTKVGILVICSGVEGILEDRFTSRLTRFAASPVDEAASSDHRDECGFACDIRIKPIGRFPEVQENILGRILGICLCSSESASERPDQSAITIDAFLNRRSIASGNFRKQKV